MLRAIERHALVAEYPWRCDVVRTLGHLDAALTSAYLEQQRV